VKDATSCLPRSGRLPGSYWTRRCGRTSNGLCPWRRRGRGGSRRASRSEAEGSGGKPEGPGAPAQRLGPQRSPAGGFEGPVRPRLDRSLQGGGTAAWRIDSVARGEDDPRILQRGARFLGNSRSPFSQRLADPGVVVGRSRVIPHWSEHERVFPREIPRQEGATGRARGLPRRGPVDRPRRDALPRTANYGERG
jgi:hypothetical protein